MSHHSSLPFSDKIHSPVIVDEPIVFGPGPQRAGDAGAGEVADQIQPVGLEPRFVSGVERRRCGQRMEQGQIAPERGHDPNARVRVSETGVDVHSTDDESSHRFLERGHELRVTLSRRGRLHTP